MTNANVTLIFSFSIFSLRFLLFRISWKSTLFPTLLRLRFRIDLYFGSCPVMCDVTLNAAVSCGAVMAWRRRVRFLCSWSEKKTRIHAIERDHHNENKLFRQGHVSLPRSMTATSVCMQWIFLFFCSTSFLDVNRKAF